MVLNGQTWPWYVTYTGPATVRSTPLATAADFWAEVTVPTRMVDLLVFLMVFS